MVGRKFFLAGDCAEMIFWIAVRICGLKGAVARLLTQRKYDDKQLRTLQRRIGQWRHIMAKQLVFGTAGNQCLHRRKQTNRGYWPESLRSSGQ